MDDAACAVRAESTAAMLRSSAKINVDSGRSGADLQAVDPVPFPERVSAFPSSGKGTGSAASNCRAACRNNGPLVSRPARMPMRVVRRRAMTTVDIPPRRRPTGTNNSSTKAGRHAEPYPVQECSALCRGDVRAGRLRWRVVRRRSQTAEDRTAAILEESGGGGTGQTPAYKILATNDLGMHCVDADFSVFSILPPYNVVNAQVIRTDSAGKPVARERQRRDAELLGDRRRQRIDQQPQCRQDQFLAVRGAGLRRESRSRARA